MGNPTGFERFLYGSFAALATLDVLHRHKVKLKFAYVIHAKEITVLAGGPRLAMCFVPFYVPFRQEVRSPGSHHPKLQLILFNLENRD